MPSMCSGQFLANDLQPGCMLFYTFAGLPTTFGADLTVFLGGLRLFFLVVAFLLVVFDLCFFVLPSFLDFPLTFAHLARCAAAIRALPAAEICRRPVRLPYAPPNAASAAATPLSWRPNRTCSFFNCLTIPISLVISYPPTPGSLSGMRDISELTPLR
jgi:hypothetical protein